MKPEGCLSSGYRSVLIETNDTDVIRIPMSYFELMSSLTSLTGSISI